MPLDYRTDMSVIQTVPTILSTDTKMSTSWMFPLCEGPLFSSLLYRKDIEHLYLTAHQLAKRARLTRFSNSQHPTSIRHKGRLSTAPTCSSNYTPTIYLGYVQLQFVKFNTFNSLRFLESFAVSYIKCLFFSNSDQGFTLLWFKLKK